MNSGSDLKRRGKYKSRPHYKSEKREQRKAWRKRKREKELAGSCAKEDLGGKSAELPVSPAKRARNEKFDGPQEGRGSKKAVNPPEENTGKPLTRGSRMVELARKHHGSKAIADPPAEQEVQMPLKRKRNTTAVHASANKPSEMTKSKRRTVIPEINPDLLIAQPGHEIGSGTFGECYLATYRGQYSVVVKELKECGASDAEKRRIKQELLGEAHVLMSLGDHEGLPHLFGICSEQSPYRLVLQFHSIDNQSLTMSKASANMEIHFQERLEIIKGVAVTMTYIHHKGFLHNDLKGNNIVLEKCTEKGTYRPIVMDFGKSVRIKDARPKKPKVNVERAARRFPHIAPEILRGSRQTPASDVYSFGKLVQSFVGECDFKERFSALIKKTTDVNPLSRISFEQIVATLIRSAVKS